MASLLLLVLFLKKSPANPWLWVSTLLVGSGLALTQTRGAWLGFAAGFILLAWRFNRKWLLIGFLTAFALFFVLPSNLQDRVKSIGHVWFKYNADHTIYNASNMRFIMWQTGLSIVKDHPWGIGQSNLNSLFFKYLNGSVFYETSIPHLHNNFMQILVQNGWIGLAAYLIWIFSFYRAVFRFKSQEPDSNDLNWTLMCVFSAVLVWGLTEYTFSHQFINFQFFLLGLQINLWRGKATV